MSDCKHERIVTYYDGDGNTGLWGCLHCDLKFVPITEVLTLEAALAEAQKDAARYRWLRGDSCPDHSVRWTRWEVRRWNPPRWTDDLRRDALDAAIDAAMEAER
jgi:hypothetical protein